MVVALDLDLKDAYNRVDYKIITRTLYDMKIVPFIYVY